MAIGWRLSFLVLVVLALGFALSRLWLVVLPVAVALLIAAVLSPPVRWLERRRVPSLLATWAIFLAVGTALIATFMLFGAQIGQEVADLPGAVDEVVEDGRSWLTDGPLAMSEGQVDHGIQRAREAIAGNRQRILSGAVSYASAALHVAAGGLMALVLAFFFVKDGPRMVDWTLDQFDAPARETVREIGRRTWSTITGYIRGSALDGLVEAVLKAVALLVLGVPLVAPLAVLTFFGGFIPFVGAVLVGGVSALVALATKGPLVALAVVGVSVVIQNIEGDLLQPLIMGKVIKLHPVVVLVSITTAGLLLGLPGAFLAVPVVASAANVVGYLRHERGRDQVTCRAGTPLQEGPSDPAG
ncbi:MAG: AI-2E family transporter [Actinobacteria bacterium]|nr:AI-2E family transporter [Actinomycetota bacterium]MBW3649974.1 AI-2E family transporter [Actinomycetota bacterium]